ncbi:glycogen synthase [Tenggerimyces flavus]|uniref:Glycogen synthase n=1 Tax=Tenggerimyces flavus TaxID=1708749 RepID=A0ABV7YDI5_9ACTN|nr:glycogen synthase [Tenggerimyces flavus]MBM7786012.1 starch synthase [Tenggerimyces flavus]
MRVALLTREFPPHVYGGAGVHVDYLSRELRSLVELSVHCLGEPRPGAVAHSEQDVRLPGANPALRIFAANLEMAAVTGEAELLHSHTWYANLAGHVGGLLHGVPHVLTAHSLEPRRPWKEEQLGGGYRLSSWAEQTAYSGAAAVIAVSHAMRDDVLDCYPFLDASSVHVVHNGIDTSLYHPVAETDVLARVGIDAARPYVVFVGRITRQKGVAHLVRAAARFDPDAQILLLAGAPDTPEIAAEMASAVASLQASRDGVVWVQEMLPREDILQALTHATVFCCPSIYEPQGIVNLEAMACETAVVASAVGGIPEVVANGETGLLVPYTPDDPETFERTFAAAVNELLGDPARAATMGRAGRERAISAFDWSAIAHQTLAVYDSVR